MKDFPSSGTWVRIAPGEVWGRSVELGEGDFLEVTIEQRGIDAALGLHDPGDEELLRVDGPSGRFGLEELLAIAPRQGTYRWTVEGLVTEQAAGDVRLLQAVSRPATAADRERVAADQAEWRGRTFAAHGAFQEAIEALQQALQAFTQQGLARRQAEVRLALGQAQAAQGSLAVAAGHAEQAVALFRQQGAGPRLAHALHLAGFLHLRLGEPEPADAALEEARLLLHEAPDTRVEAVLLARLGSAQQALGQTDRAISSLNEALEKWLGAGGGAEMEAAFLTDLGWALLAAGRTGEAGARFDEAMALANRHSLDGVVPPALRGAAEAASRGGQHELAWSRVQEALSKLVPSAEPRERMAVLLTSGQVLRRKGQAGAARTVLEDALSVARAVGDRRSEAILLLELGFLATQRGEPGQGLELCDQSRALFEAIGDLAGRERAARRAQEARNALLPLGAPVPAASAFLPLEGPRSRESGDAGRRASTFWDIEGSAAPKAPVNLSETDLPGDEGRTWCADPKTLEELEKARVDEESRLRDQERGFGEGLSFALAGDVPVDPASWSVTDPLLGLDPAALVNLVAGSESTSSAVVRDELRLCREYEKQASDQARDQKGRFELPSDIDPHDLSMAGWGIVFAADEDPAVEHHLRGLIELRQRQAGARFKRIVYRRGDSGRKFLWQRNGEAPGVLDPDTLPYYLLLVGSPEQIPFDVQYQLSINHAVGRICFPCAEDYGEYALRLLEAEGAGTDLPRQAAIFSAENGDPATNRLAEHLVAPLERRLSGYAGWQLAVRRKEQARKEDLAALLGGTETPGLLLVSCHGMPCPPGSPWQQDCQGALECQRVPGASNHFQAGDLSDSTRLRGLIAFLFACYGAGTPVEDNFAFVTRDGAVASQPRPQRLAPKPFIARLPQALLKQGALAVVGHVDRGWTLSFAWTVSGAQTCEAVRSLEDSLKQLLKGHRLGHALRPIYRRYTALAAQLLEPVERHHLGREVDREVLAVQWVAHNDARNFVVLGDPAVYLLGKPPAREVDPDRVRLDPAVLATVANGAAARGMSVESWVNEMLQQRAG